MVFWGVLFFAFAAMIWVLSDPGGGGGGGGAALGS